MIGRAGVIAFLLTRSSASAQAAVLAAIEDWCPEEGEDRLVRKVAVRALELDKLASQCWPLPAELTAVAHLRTDLRRAFVLKWLVAFNLEEVSELLGVDESETNRLITGALTTLGTATFLEKEARV